MMIYLLNRKQHETRKKKIKAVKSQNFEEAAHLREKEKMITNRIRKIREEKIMYRKKARCSPWVKEYSIKACFVQPAVGELPVRIEFYPYATWLNIYLIATINELKRIEYLWKHMKFKQKSKTKNIIELASEYHLIDLIFQYLECKHGIFTIDRNQIHSYLESNPIFNLITLHPKERQNFTIDDADANIRSCYSYDDNQNINGFYKRFSYDLPFKCSLTQNDGQVIITSSLFSIYIKVNFDFDAYTLPFEYAKYYLGFKKSSGRKVHFHIMYQLKWRMALPWNWKYKKKLRKLQKAIEEDISADHYFKTIDWKQMRMQAVITENIIQSSKTGLNELSSGSIFI